jgi:hypothetical protein
VSVYKVGAGKDGVKIPARQQGSDRQHFKAESDSSGSGVLLNTDPDYRKLSTSGTLSKSLTERGVKSSKIRLWFQAKLHKHESNNNPNYFDDYANDNGFGDGPDAWLNCVLPSFKNLSLTAAIATSPGVQTAISEIIVDPNYVPDTFSPE